MMTVDDALKISDVSCAIGSYPNVLASEVRRLRDEVNGLTGSLDRAEKALKEAQEQEPVAWRLWWAQERERQLLQNLNQSQSVE